MKNECELRFLNINEEEFIKKIEEAGAQFVGSWLQKRYVYDFKPKIDGKWIRLRTNGEVSTLTIKEIASGKIDGTKELEIVVSNFENTNRILEELGYHARSIQENKRIRYILDEVEIDIDTWPKINTYVEFEGRNEESIQKAVKKLGMNFDDGTTMDVQSIYLSLGHTLDEMNNLSFEEE